MFFFMRGECGPIEMVNKTICLKIRKIIQFLNSAQQRMEELQATTERRKCTETTSMTVQVDLGSLRAASTTWSTET